MTQTFNKSRHLPKASIVALLAASLFPLNIVAMAAAELPSDWQERIKIGVHAYDTGDSHWASERFSRLMMDGEQKLGSTDGRMARIYTNLGEVYSQQELWDSAEQCLKRGLNVAENAYGANSPETVPALIDLAQMNVHQGNYTKAQPFFKRALAIVDKSGDDSLLPYVVVIEADLGAMYFADGNYAASEAHFKRAQAVATKCLGPNHKWTTTIGGMYAASLKQIGRAQEAKTIERAAVAKANETQTTIFVWNKQIGLADAAMADKRFPEAEAALKWALQASRDLSDEPLLQVVTLTRYGRLFLLEEKPALAIEKYKAAQLLADSVLGLEDKATLEHAKQLADLERSQDQYPDAEPLYLRLVTHAKKQSGPESDEYARAMMDLAGLYNSWAQYPRAVTYYSRVLALQEKQFGTDSDKLIPVLVALATVVQNNTQYLSEVNQKSEEYLKRAAKIGTKKFGKDSKEVAAILDGLSVYYQRHFDWDKAVKMCTQVIAANEKNFGPDSAETTKALEHYAVVLRAAGLRSQAEPIEARIARIKGLNAESDN